MGQKVFVAVISASVKKSELASVMINVLNMKPTCEILCRWTGSSTYTMGTYLPKMDELL